MSVWQGRLDDGRLVAVKTPSDSGDRRVRRRLLAQARKGRTAGLSRVLRPLALDRKEPSVTWPWVLGRDLATRLARHGPPDRQWAVAIADEIDATVRALHGRGLVHGSLRADHVLLDMGGHPVLIGLDPAARFGADSQNHDLTAAAAIRDRLFGRDSEPSLRASSPTLEGPPGRRRARWPVAAGLAVTAAGALVGLTRPDADPACPDRIDADGLWADVDGDDCADRLEWSIATGSLSADTASGTRTWRLGRPGDRFVLGDWNCDGAPTPGLHRPVTGRTYGFDRWPADGAIEATLIEGPPTCEG